VVGVRVRVDALEVGREGEFDRLDVRQLAEDAVGADPLAVAGRKEYGFVHRRASS
jgi:hypothetical protein